jgi:hypothetical protein
MTKQICEIGTYNWFYYKEIRCMSFIRGACNNIHQNDRRKMLLDWTRLGDGIWLTLFFLNDPVIFTPKVSKVEAKSSPVKTAIITYFTTEFQSPEMIFLA